jgi:pyridoxine 5-phosphate synthase
MKQKTALSVNVNKVALLRNSRALGIPSVIKAAELCLAAGAAGITVHPRPDARHIRPQDVADMANLLAHWPDREFNIEGNPLHNLMDFMRQYRPDQVTFVPDSEGQATSDHGWSFPADALRLAPMIAEAKALGVRVSLFMDPIAEQMAAVKALGADRVELYTEPYARAFALGDQAQLAYVIEQYQQAALTAQQLGLGVNAGHDLNRDNLGYFLRAVPNIKEVSIGHALIADALELGYSETIRAYLACIPGGFVA